MAAVVCLPLLAVALFAQTSQQSSQQSSQQPAGLPAPTGPAQQAEQTSDSPQAAPKGPAAPLQLHNITPEPHTATPAEIQAQKAARLRAELSHLATMEANWGPTISPHGMSLTLKKVGSKQTPTGTRLSYHLIGTGFTPDMRLTLLRWPLDGSISQVLSGIVVDASGTAVCGIAAPGPSAPTDAQATKADAAAASRVPSCSKTMKPGTPITLTATVAKGEPIRIALIALDQKHGAAASLVPFPIEGQDKGCKINVVLGAKSADLILVEGSGFKQDKSYTLGSESYGVKNGLSASIKPDGHFVTALLPAIPGHPSGTTTIYYQSATCTPTVSFNWGKGTYQVQ
ncbi:MAG TPA: hypothetical protein VMU92_11390 [Acidobacteriaceae bacterium]|nr:hypothetical protein [Acidobacteriaceae bacterium]